MGRSSRVSMVAFSLVFAASGVAHADEEDYFEMPGAQVVLAKGKVWGVYPHELDAPISPLQMEWGGWYFEPRAYAVGDTSIRVPYSFAVTCPDIDEHVSKIEFKAGGKKIVHEYGGSIFFDKGVIRRVHGSVEIGWKTLYDIAKNEGTGSLHYVFKVWCEPPRTDPCDAPREALAHTYDDAIADTIVEVFANNAVPASAEIGQQLRARLNDYAQAWWASRQQVCAPTTALGHYSRRTWAPIAEHLGSVSA